MKLAKFRRTVFRKTVCLSSKLGKMPTAALAGAYPALPLEWKTCDMFISTYGNGRPITAHGLYKHEMCRHVVFRRCDVMCTFGWWSGCVFFCFVRWLAVYMKAITLHIRKTIGKMSATRSIDMVIDPQLPTCIYLYLYNNVFLFLYVYIKRYTGHTQLIID